MRRMLPLLLVLGAACQDAQAPLAPAAADALQARGGRPGAPTDPIQVQSLTAGISGPSSVGNAQTCDYTGSASGGTAPYSYRWVPSYSGPNSYFVGGAGPSNVFHGTGYYTGGGTSTTIWLFLEVTDANSLTASTTRYMTLYSTAVGCN
ncbi:MAG TPA: hypothetical protein VFR37_20060 [Longimicrobium sp.]|nr:hypothetical protein [Longimicrobium sp.]